MNLAAFETCLGLLALWGFWHFCWRDLAVDQMRQSLFQVRDKLFDIALKEGQRLQFEHPAYVQTRTLINATIRYGHTISFFGSLIYGMIATFPFKGNPFLAKPYLSPIDVTISKVEDADLRGELEGIQRQVYVSVMKFMLKTSPILLGVVALMSILVLLYFIVDLTWKHAGLSGLKAATRDHVKGKLSREIQLQTDGFTCLSQEMPLAAA